MYEATYTGRTEASGDSRCPYILGMQTTHSDRYSLWVAPRVLAARAVCTSLALPRDARRDLRGGLIHLAFAHAHGV